MGADRVTVGPLSSNATNSFDTQALVLDVQNNTLSISGASRKLAALQSAIAVVGAQTALTAITAAQVLLSQAFNQGALNVQNRTIRVSGSLIYSTTAANAATISLALVLGGVTLCTITTAPTNTAASTNLPIQFEFELSVASLGATATIESHGSVAANIGTVAAAAIANYLDTNTAVSGAVNLLAATTLEVQIAASAAVPSAQLRQATIELVA